MRFSTTTTAALVLAGVLCACSAAASDEVRASPESEGQAKKVVDIRVPDENLTQRLTLTDGSQIYGRVESVEADAIVFRSVTGVTLTAMPADIMDLRVVAGRIVSGEFLPVDSHNTRLLFAPTARSLRRGEGYVGFYEAVLPFVQVGVTDRFSIGGGTPLVFGGDGGSRPLWFTPKLQVLAREKAQAAVGVIHFQADQFDGGIGYGVTTLGPAEKATSIGFGYAYSSEGSGGPIVMIGGEYRATRRIKWITENWIWRGGNGFVSGGIRFLGERLSADVGLIVPLIDEPVAFPLVSFAWSF